MVSLGCLGVVWENKAWVESESENEGWFETGWIKRGKILRYLVMENFDCLKNEN